MRPTSHFLPVRGLDLARKAIALAAAGSAGECLSFAARRWGSKSTVVQLIKADVSGHEIGDADFPTDGTAEGAAEFAEVVDMGGLLRDLVPVPANVPFIGAVTDPVAYWVGGGQAVPFSRAVLDRSVLQPKEVATALVLTDQLIRSQDPRAELLVLQMMLRAARKARDAAISDPSNTGDDTTPAAITSDATPINSSGSLDADAEAAIGAFGGSLETACWWMHPRLAAQANLGSGGFGAGSGLGALGGQLAGLPVLTSDGMRFSESDGGDLVLVDRASVALVDDGYDVQRSRQATIELSDAPTGDTAAPTAAATTSVSLFQANAVALMLVRRVNWHLANPDAVSVVSGCAWAW